MLRRPHARGRALHRVPRRARHAARPGGGAHRDGRPRTRRSRSSATTAARALWDGVDLRRRVDFAAIGLDLDTRRRARSRANCAARCAPGITPDHLKQTVVLNAKSLMERDADFSEFAARILLTYIYEEMLGWDILRDGVGRLAAFHRRALQRDLRARRGDRAHQSGACWNTTSSGWPRPSTPRPTWTSTSSASRPSTTAISSWTRRRPAAPPRDAAGVLDARGHGPVRARGGRPRGPGHRALRLYKGRRFCSRTPTFQRGTLHSQLSSCYLYKVDDSSSPSCCAASPRTPSCSKWAGGLGGSWTPVRGTGAHIKGTNGETQGVIPFLKLHNDQLVAVNQGGKRARAPAAPTSRHGTTTSATSSSCARTPATNAAARTT